VLSSTPWRQGRSLLQLTASPGLLRRPTLRSSDLDPGRFASFWYIRRVGTDRGLASLRPLSVQPARDNRTIPSREAPACSSRFPSWNGLPSSFGYLYWYSLITPSLALSEWANESLHLLIWRHAFSLSLSGKHFVPCQSSPLFQGLSRGHLSPDEGGCALTQTSPTSLFERAFAWRITRSQERQMGLGKTISFIVDEVLILDVRKMRGGSAWSNFGHQLEEETAMVGQQFWEIPTHIFRTP
jgi:hypothetical protein